MEELKNMFTESQGWGGGGVGGGKIQRLNNRHFQLCPTIYPTLQPLRPHLSLSKEVDRGESRHLTPSSALLLHQRVLLPLHVMVSLLLLLLLLLHFFFPPPPLSLLQFYYQPPLFPPKCHVSTIYWPAERALSSCVP